MADTNGRPKPGDMVVNDAGGAQSALRGAPYLIPAEALLRISGVVCRGAERYAINNWRLIPFEEHVSHALEHLFLMMNGDDSGEDHLGNALTRLSFAVATEPKEPCDFKAWRPLKGKAEKPYCCAEHSAPPESSRCV